MFGAENQSSLLLASDASEDAEDQTCRHKLEAIIAHQAFRSQQMIIALSILAGACALLGVTLLIRDFKSCGDGMKFRADPIHGKSEYAQQDETMCSVLTNSRLQHAWTADSTSCGPDLPT